MTPTPPRALVAGSHPAARPAAACTQVPSPVRLAHVPLLLNRPSANLADDATSTFSPLPHSLSPSTHPPCNTVSRPDVVPFPHGAAMVSGGPAWRPASASPGRASLGMATQRAASPGGLAPRRGHPQRPGVAAHHDALAGPAPYPLRSSGEHRPSQWSLLCVAARRKKSAFILFIFILFYLLPFRACVHKKNCHHRSCDPLRL